MSKRINSNPPPFVGDIITENMGVYVVLKDLGSSRFRVQSHTGFRLAIDWNDSGYLDPGNAWHIDEERTRAKRFDAYKLAADRIRRGQPWAGDAQLCDEFDRRYKTSLSSPPRTIYDLPVARACWEGDQKDRS